MFNRISHLIVNHLTENNREENTSVLKVLTTRLVFFREFLTDTSKSQIS